MVTIKMLAIFLKNTSPVARVKLSNISSNLYFRTCSVLMSLNYIRSDMKFVTVNY